MPIITGIVPSTEQPGYVVILVDGAPFATVPEQSVSRLGLAEGGVAGELLSPPDGPEQRTYERALSLLSFQARSSRELQKSLIEKGEPAGSVAKVIARLEASGLLDDARFAEGRARAGIVGKTRSRWRIKQDLAQRGVTGEVADEAIRRVFAEEDTDETRVAERAARKKLRTLSGLPAPAQRAKLYGFLARQGYTPDVVRRVMLSVLDATPPDGSDE